MVDVFKATQILFFVLLSLMTGCMRYELSPTEPKLDGQVLSQESFLTGLSLDQHWVRGRSLHLRLSLEQSQYQVRRSQDSRQVEYSFTSLSEISAKNIEDTPVLSALGMLAGPPVDLVMIMTSAPVAYLRARSARQRSGPETLVTSQRSRRRLPSGTRVMLVFREGFDRQQGLLKQGRVSFDMSEAAQGCLESGLDHLSFAVDIESSSKDALIPPYGAGGRLDLPELIALTEAAMPKNDVLRKAAWQGILDFCPERAKRVRQALKAEIDKIP